MKIETGKGSISLLALLGIWSVAALTSLPGLAVSPILGNLSDIFKDATELDIQTLATLPSLLIIPFILLAGKLSDRVGYIRLLYTGLSLFLLNGLLYFLCNTIDELIFVSAMLGVGAGIIIPLSTSLVSRFFSGEKRTRQFGYISAINNLTLVAATAITGYLAEIGWRLPFLVYLLPVVSLLLVGQIKKADTGTVAAVAGKRGGIGTAKHHTDKNAFIGLTLYYLLITYLTIIVSVNLPFLMTEYGHDSGSAGLVISLFFLFIMLPGFFLNKILTVIHSKVLLVCLLLIACGLLIIFFNKNMVLIVVGVLLAGGGYGIAQPYIYDRTVFVVPPEKTTFALALVMTMNYVAVVVSPLVTDGLQRLSGVDSERFAFALNSCIGVLALVAMCIKDLFTSDRKV